MLLYRHDRNILHPRHALHGFYIIINLFIVLFTLEFYFIIISTVAPDQNCIYTLRYANAHPRSHYAYIYIFFFINDDLSPRDTPLFVGGIRAAAARRFEGRTWRDWRGHQTRTYVCTSFTHHPFVVPFLIATAAAKLRNPRDCYEVGDGRGEGRPAVPPVIIIIVVIFCQRPMTRENREHNNSAV